MSAFYIEVRYQRKNSTMQLQNKSRTADSFSATTGTLDDGQ
jgi:hypothetical protein